MIQKPVESAASKRMGRAVGLCVALGLGTMAFINVFAFAAAVRTDSGLVTEDYYQKSLIKDPEDTRRERFATLGWKAHLAGPGPDGRFAVVLRDAGGRPIAGAAVETVFFRTTQAGLDREATLAQTAPGRYSGRVEGLVAGQYQAKFRIRRGAEDVNWHRRLVAPEGR